MPINVKRTEFELNGANIYPKRYRCFLVSFSILMLADQFILYIGTN